MGKFSKSVTVLLLHILTIMLCLKIAATCSESKSTFVIDSYSYTGYTDTKLTKAALGTVSNSIYYYGSVSTPNNYAVIQKVNSAGTQVWNVVYRNEILPSAFAVAPNEAYLYAGINPTGNAALMQVDASTGGVTNTVKTTSYTNVANSKVNISPDSTTVFFSTAFGGVGYFCVWCPTIPTFD